MNENESQVDDVQNQDQTDVNNEGAGNDPNTNVDIAALQAEISKLRKEAASYRTKSKELQSQLAQANPTIENATARIAALEQSLADQKRAADLMIAESVASQMGFQNPSLAQSFLGETDFVGGKQSIAERLSAIAKDNPYLLKSTRTDASAHDHSTDQNNPNAWLLNLMKK